MNFSIFKDLDINLFDEGDYNISLKNNSGHVCGMKDENEDEPQEVDEMREIYLNSDDKCKDDISPDVCADIVIVGDGDGDDDDVDKLCGWNICNDIYVNLRPIELLINTASVDEVIFKKYLVEILNKHSRECVMEGVVVGYDLVGRSYDPDIVLKFKDGRTFYNDNFGYLLRYYI
jgi:hypothetical protein